MIYTFVQVIYTLVALCFTAAVGSEVGYRRGVSETERRWSEAVKRAEYARAKEGEPR